MSEDNMPERGPDAFEIAHGAGTIENEILPVREDELIDVSAFNFEDEERWLYVSSQHSGDSAIQDLRAWLRGESDQDLIESDAAAKRSIDTRTFTRPKKRSSRMSFESIMETVGPAHTNLWKLPNSHYDLQVHQNPIVPPRRETIPAMLRLNSTFSNSVLPENNTGQESLEAFLNKSQSKGIDSFINMTEPEFSDELMSISQPSDMNSSILSVAQTDKDFSSLEDSQILTESMMKTSMFETSSFGKLEETFLTNKSADYDRTLSNEIRQDPMKKVMNATFDARSENPVLSLSKNSPPLRLERFDLNSTCSTIVGNQSLSISSDVYKTYDIRKERGKSIGGFNDSYRTYSVKDRSQNRRDSKGLNYLNDTYRTRDLADDLHSVNGLSDHFQDLNIMNSTHIARDITEERPHSNRMPTCLSDSYQASNLSLINQSRELNSHNDTFRDPKCLNDTYCERNSSLERSQVSAVPNCLNDTYQAQNIQVKSWMQGFKDSKEIHQESSCLNDTYRTESSSVESSQPLRVTSRLNDTYKACWDSSKRKETLRERKSLSTLNDTYSSCNAIADGNRGALSKCLNDTYRAEAQDFQDLENDLTHVVDENRALNNLPKQEVMEHLEISPQNLMNTTYNGSMSLRRELLEEVQRSSAKNCEQIPNRFNTYRKSPSRTQKAPNSGSTDLLVEDKKLENRTVDDVLSRATAGALKSSAEGNIFKVPQEEPKVSKTYNPNAKTSSTLKTMVNEEKRMDSMFSKPSRKLRSPRVLSKLPQFLQKSNPNLKSLPMTKMHSGLSYVKGSQPNLTFSMGRMKSGSEQRLMDVARTTNDFLKKGAGSTESIESTQSAHSAPDLDDRLSVCSDSSHNSYSVRGMNIEQLQNIARMQEESLKQISTPKPTRRVLENAWIDPDKDKNLPSPIRKISTDRIAGESISPDNMGSTPKTSSPIYSPEGSSQSLHTAGIQLNDQTCIIPSNNADEALNKKIEVPPLRPPKTTVPAESKSRLRQPTNWTSSSRPTGIPRPTLRTVTRPATKTNLDWRKGF